MDGNGEKKTIGATDDDCSPREELNCDFTYLGINISHPNIATLYTYIIPSEASRTFDNECSVVRFLAETAATAS